MTRDLALAQVTAYLRQHFGRMLVPRDVRRVRRAGGLTWVVRVVAAAAVGDIPIAEVDVDETGALAPQLTVDDVVRALRRPVAPGEVAPRSWGGMSGMFDDLLEAAEDPEGGDEPLVSRVYTLLAAGDEASLFKARELLPRLLGDPERRGVTLMRMAEIERRLGEKPLAIGYVEAAAREFADRFAMSSIEQAAAMALELAGPDAFNASPLYDLLERCRARLRPIASLFDAPALSDLPEQERSWVLPLAKLRTLAPGETLVKEGDPSRAVFVVKSGLLAVLIEKPLSRLVRCCPPGWLVGESSVLNLIDPRCTASLRAEQVTEIWQIDAAVMLEVMKRSTSVQEFIAETKKLYRLDSFFSMHETMGQLDVQVRDELLACLQSIQTFDDDTVVLLSGDVPAVACLVARGVVALHRGWEITGQAEDEVGADRFLGMRDALHQIPSPFTAVARRGSTIAFFDAERVRSLVERSPEQVGVVLERLG